MYLAHFEPKIRSLLKVVFEIWTICENWACFHRNRLGDTVKQIFFLIFTYFKSVGQASRFMKP